MATFKVLPDHDELQTMLRFEGGDTIISLGTDARDHLLLHSSVLKAASPYFEAGMKAVWTKGAEPRKVTNPKTGEGIDVYRYHLVEDQCVLFLQVKKPAQAEDQWADSPLMPVSRSEFGAGITERTRVYGDWEDIPRSIIIQDAVKEHQALFLFLHKISVERWLDLSYENIANVIAYAQTYQLLQHIGPSIEQHLLGRCDIWSDTGRFAAFHLGIANKIRSSPLFFDALRHFVGSRQDCLILVAQLEFSEEGTALLIVSKRDALDHQVSHLTKQLQRLALTPTPPHMYGNNSRIPKSLGGSTFLASASDSQERSLTEKAYFFARSIFNEWMTHQLAGLPHWPPMWTSNGERKDERLQPAGLRFLCNAIVHACAVEDELSLFDEDAPYKIASMFFGDDSRREAQTHISDALTLLVRTAYGYILPLITPPPSQSIAEEERYFRPPKPAEERKQGQSFTERYTFRLPNSLHITKGGLIGGQVYRPDDVHCARDDNGCPYFTCMEMSTRDLPWYGEEPWNDYCIDGLEDASDEWLDLTFSAYGEKHAYRWSLDAEFDESELPANW